ncbi:MAG: hypothetical protein HQL49_13810, partial [Gammaproteobacteria bacterium]|nr:hypothetical protein [Gammaproteobacteria bacterium]
MSYYSEIIRMSRVKICITNQDANTIFFDLAREHPSIRFIALQQGLKDNISIGYFDR